MEIIIKEVRKGEKERITIECHQLTEEHLRLINAFRTEGDILNGYLDNVVQRISHKDVLYFESVDKKVFIYCENATFESKQKLFELEEILRLKGFLRISKTTIINLKKIKKLIPALSGRLEAILENEEKVVISRQYVGDLKNSLGL